jgi:phosphoserine phosphatase
VVVDGANDLKLFDIAGYTVGFCPVDIVKKRADDVIEIRNLSLLKNLLEKRFGNWILKSNQANEKIEKEEEMKNKIR